jgi:transcription initiation factor TFIIF subunit beta
MEKWQTIEQEDVVLGTLRVYHAPDPSGNQRLVLRLPESTDPAVYDTSTLPKQYSLKMQSKAVENEFVLASKMKERERNLSAPHPYLVSSCICGGVR